MIDKESIVGALGIIVFALAILQLNVAIAAICICNRLARIAVAVEKSDKDK